MMNRIPLKDDPMKGEIVFDPGMYTASSEWELISAEAKINEVQYECCPEKYQDMTFTFVQKRLSPHEL